MVVENKKAQMKIQQMAFMLIAVMVFFSLIGIVILSFQLSDLKGSASSLEERNALLLVTKLSNSPEFSCGSAFGTTRIHCVDLDKVMVLKQNINKYSNFWDVKNIEIRKIYPSEEDEIHCNLENYPNCNIIELIPDAREGVGIANFVSLCRKEDGKDKCELGKLIVSYETP